MHRVKKCEFNPGYCAVSGASEDPWGFIDTLNTLPQYTPRIFVAGAAIDLLAKEKGYEPLEWQENAKARLRAQKEEIEDLKAQLLKQADYIEAVQKVLPQFDPEPPAAALAA